MDFDDFDKFKKFKKKDQTLKEDLKEVADQLLPQLKRFGPMAPIMIPALVGQIVDLDQIKAAVNAGQFDDKFAELAAQAQGLTRLDIVKLLKLDLTLEEAKELIAKGDKAHADLSEAEAVAIMKAGFSILPDAYSALIAGFLTGGKTVEGSVADIKKKSVEERAQEMIARNGNTALNEALVDAVYGVAQQVTAESLKQAVVNFLDSVDEGAVPDLALKGFGFVQDLLTTVKSRNVIGVKNAAQAAAFGKSLKDIFNKAVSGLESAGIAMDPQAKKQLEALIKTPPANNNTPEKKDVKKKPGPGKNFDL